MAEPAAGLTRSRMTPLQHFAGASSIIVVTLQVGDEGDSTRRRKGASDAVATASGSGRGHDWRCLGLARCRGRLGDADHGCPEEFWLTQASISASASPSSVRA